MFWLDIVTIALCTITLVVIYGFGYYYNKKGKHDK